MLTFAPDTPWYAAPLPGAGDRAPGLFHELLALPWLQVTPARKEYFMSGKPRTYAYKTWEGPREYQSAAWSPGVDGLRLAANVMMGADFNVCFLNRYENEQNQLGWHADDSPEMDHDHPILVVSFGAERDIWWKPKNHKGEIPGKWRRRLAHGSFFVMPAGFQRDWVHRIPKNDRPCGVRISLTFRHYLDRAPVTETAPTEEAA